MTTPPFRARRLAPAILLAPALLTLAARGARSKLSACPAGWIIGDQAKPGGRRGMNALSGTWGGGE